MSNQDPVPAQRNRVGVFVDFWNYTLSKGRQNAGHINYDGWLGIRLWMR